MTVSRLPTGTLTFVFTDIEGSTRLLQRLGDDYVRVLDDHNRIIRKAITTYGGIEVRPIGDAFFAVFTEPRDAVRAVLDAQLALNSYGWPEGTQLRIRIGVHTGDAAVTGEDYVGLAVHQASRISDAGHGNQILLSAATAAMTAGDLPSGATLHDLGEHRLRDIVEPQRIFEIRHPELSLVEKPLRTLSARPNNLPAQLTSFIGRDSEMSDLKSRLVSGVPMVTLLGPGGSGKTRLSVEVASELLGEYPDGVWFVELAEVSSDALVVQAAAGALGVQEEPGRELGSTLTQRLEGTKTLLVLDNCEHVVWGAAELASWILRTCPGVQVLATSRELLAVEGEVTWVVPPLSVPAEGANDPSDAVRLFVDRAEAVNPRLRFTEESTVLIGEICRRLDGIPLALELAAARVDVLSLQQICRRLDDRFALLTKGSRTAIPRQQTLRALVDWSYDLLEPGDRVLLNRLGVFAGGFTLEAAEVVASGDPVTRDDVLDGLSALIRRSLVIVDDIDGEHRYRLLETIRQYVLEKLEASSEARELRRRHRRCVCDLVATTRHKDFVAASIHDRFELEAANIRAALESGIADDNIEDALQICSDMSYFWWLRGHISEGESWLSVVLAKADGVDEVLRGHALLWRGLLAFQRFDWDTAMPVLRESLAIGEHHDDELLVARALTWLTVTTAVIGEFEQSHDYLRRRFEGGDGMIQEPERAGWLYLLGSIYRLYGEAEPAQTALDEAVAAARRVRASYVLGRAVPVLANQALDRGDVQAARELYQEALDVARETNDRVALARCLVYFAEASIDTGDFERAVSHLREARPIVTIQIGFPVLAARLEVAEARLDLCAGRLDEARAHLKRSLDLDLELGYEKGLVDGRTWLAEVELADGNIESAATELRQTLELTAHLNEPERHGRALELLGRTSIASGNLEQAERAFAESAAIADQLGSDAQRAATKHGQGRLALARGDTRSAIELLERALEGRRAIGNQLAVAETLESLAAAKAATGDTASASAMLEAANERRTRLSCPAPASVRNDVERLRATLEAT